MEESNKGFNTGYISAIIGSLIKIKGLENHVRLHDLVKISNYQDIRYFFQSRDFESNFEVLLDLFNDLFQRKVDRGINIENFFNF